MSNKPYTGYAFLVLRMRHHSRRLHKAGLCEGNLDDSSSIQLVMAFSSAFVEAIDGEDVQLLTFDFLDLPYPQPTPLSLCFSIPFTL